MSFVFFFFLTFCFFNPSFVQSDISGKAYVISENIKTISNYLKEQDYFESISKLCHEDECFAIDVHDLKHSIETIEEKMLRRIEERLGSEEALRTSLKGFSITKILTR